MFKNYLALVLILSMVALLLYFSLDRGNIHELNLASTFKEHNIDSACFEIYDHSHDQVFQYKAQRLGKQICPASTFKIFNSLVALETNTIPDIDFVIPWDGITRWNPDWSKDMDMVEAFKVSSVPYYQEVARRVGRKNFQLYMDSVKYGNMKIGDSIDKFWLDNSLLISPDEQVGLMKKLYFDKLPFSARTHRLVRTLMLKEETEKYKLYCKTGTSQDAHFTQMQLVGFIEVIEHQKAINSADKETNYRPYFFAMEFTQANDKVDMKNSRELRIQLLKKICTDLKIWN